LWSFITDEDDDDGDNIADVSSWWSIPTGVENVSIIDFPSDEPYFCPPFFCPFFLAAPLSERARERISFGLFVCLLGSTDTLPVLSLLLFVGGDNAVEAPKALPLSALRGPAL
jgi:hypothetical protein